MTQDATKQTVTFTKDAFIDEPSSDTITLRDRLYNRFTTQIGLLLESKRPRKISTTKGRLDSRLAYRYPFTDTIFKAHQHIPTSDTTIVMLVDGSGSMSSYVNNDDNLRVSRLQVSNAICSAFGKAVDRVLNNQLKFEVFLKSCGGVKANQLGTKGAFLNLTRVLTNTKRGINNFDEILGMDCQMPFTIDGESQGSYTAEYGVLPALCSWMSKNITTKNTIVFNLTDGETYAVVGEEGRSLYNVETKELRNKYLRGIPNFSMMIGREMSENEQRDIYGDNVIGSTDSLEGMTNKMFSTLMTLLDSTIT